MYTLVGVAFEAGLSGVQTVLENIGFANICMLFRNGRSNQRVEVTIYTIEITAVGKLALIAFFKLYL